MCYSSVITSQRLAEAEAVKKKTPGFTALIATFQFYFSAQEVLEMWLEYQYVLIFRAIFSFFVLCACIYLTRFYITSWR